MPHFVAAAKSTRPRPSLGIGLGLLGRNQRKTGEARHCFEQAVLLSPEDPFLLSNLAVVLGDSGQIPEFIRNFEGAFQIHPEAMTARSNLLLTLHSVDANRSRSECRLGSGSETPGCCHRHSLARHPSSQWSCSSWMKPRASCVSVLLG